MISGTRCPVSLDDEIQNQRTPLALDEITETEPPGAICDSPPHEVSSIGESSAPEPEHDQAEADVSQTTSSENSDMIAENLETSLVPSDQPSQQMEVIQLGRGHRQRNIPAKLHDYILSMVFGAESYRDVISGVD
ncbi:hypothetical protein F2Q70_00026724 [Brassica cretica]|uniref:Uncharacterized protein n=1 Tax=Brassica cretica TaxID=69181 RepID=A0A8S9LGJ0_BRACR|nr:hypothetical protein F2Q70_00026724 [Brassica cretica]